MNRTGPATVVITGSGTVTCQSVIKALRMQDEIPVEIVTVDAADQVAGRYFSDHFYKVPSASDPSFVPEVLGICRSHDAALLIPIVDYEFAPLSDAMGLFEQVGCLVGMSPPSVIRMVNDKLAADEFYREHGFATARTWTETEAREQKAELPYPVFLKPALDGRSSIDCYAVSNADDLELYLDRVPGLMVQELIDAPEFTADVLADWSSSVLGVVIRERLETKGGVSYKGRTVSDPVLQAEVIRLVELMGIRGPANVQVFRRENEVLFNEVNPRFSGALALSLAAGLNSPLILLKLALDMPVQPVIGRTRAGVTMLRYWDEVFVDPEGSPIFPAYRLEPDRRLIPA